MAGITNIEDARKKAQGQVYSCGVEDCGRQDWRLHDTYALVCNGCDSPSSATWFIPGISSKKNTKLRAPRKKMLRTIKKEGYVCGYCSNITFHMHETGILTCFRCKKEALFRFYFPQTVGA